MILWATGVAAKRAKVYVVELVGGKAFLNHAKAMQKGDQEGGEEALRVLRTQLGYIEGTNENQLGLSESDILPQLMNKMKAALET